MALELLFCKMLLPGFDQNSTHHTWCVAFSLNVSLKSGKCSYTIVPIRLQIPVLFNRNNKISICSFTCQ